MKPNIKVWSLYPAESVMSIFCYFLVIILLLCLIFFPYRYDFDDRTLDFSTTGLAVAVVGTITGLFFLATKGAQNSIKLRIRWLLALSVLTAACSSWIILPRFQLALREGNVDNLIGKLDIAIGVYLLVFTAIYFSFLRMTQRPNDIPVLVFLVLYSFFAGWFAWTLFSRIQTTLENGNVQQIVTIAFSFAGVMAVYFLLMRWTLSFAEVALIAFLVFFTGVVGWLSWKLLPRLQSSLENGNVDEINKLVLPIAAMVGVYFLVWRTWIADRQRHFAQEELYTSLLTKAVDQLGATREEKNGEGKSQTIPNIEVRLGAIYALEKLARDYIPLHSRIMEILCAYIRENAGEPRPRSDEVAAILTKPPRDRSDREIQLVRKHWDELRPRIDIQSALTAIGRRSEKQKQIERQDVGSTSPWADNELNLSGCHLGRVNLCGLHFEGVNFSESCLEGALLKGSNLRNSWFFRAHIENAQFQFAYVEGVQFDRANIERADFSNAIGLTQERIDAAFGDDKTVIPEELVRPARWSKSKCEMQH